MIIYLKTDLLKLFLCQRVCLGKHIFYAADPTLCYSIRGGSIGTGLSLSNIKASPKEIEVFDEDLRTELVV